MTAAIVAPLSPTSQGNPDRGTGIVPDAVYTTKQGALLVHMHPKTLARKIRAGLLRAKGAKYRIKGSELLKLA